MILTLGGILSWPHESSGKPRKISRLLASVTSPSDACHVVTGHQKEGKASYEDRAIPAGTISIANMSEVTQGGNIWGSCLINYRTTTL